MHQVNELRARILDAAEKLFLRNGLEKTRMLDIAAEAGITKMSLYRYFPNRDVIALEIQKRMINRIATLIAPGESRLTREMTRHLIQKMIRNFDALRDAYRYIGMFDHLYLDNPPENALTQWTKRLILDSPSFGGFMQDEMPGQGVDRSRFIMVMSTVIWFLEKLALRGELTWSDQAVSLENNLQLFEDMILSYVDQNMASAMSKGQL